jgi:hypothetical protein
VFLPFWLDESDSPLHFRNSINQGNDRNSNIMNPQAIKGIVGELAAVLGPKVVDESAVILF